jgi:hypothetical protein
MSDERLGDYKRPHIAIATLGQEGSTLESLASRIFLSKNPRERRTIMRQVIRPFLNHLDAEKNASSSTIDTYRYDLNNSTIIWHIGREQVPTR